MPRVSDLFRDRSRGPVSIVVMLAWVVAMAVLVNRSYLQASSASMATDLARYGSTRDVARRVLPRREDRLHRQPDRADRRRVRARGRRPAADVAARRDDRRHASARPLTSTRASRCASFEFSLDPGTGPIEVRGTDRRAAASTLDVTTAGRHAHRRARADRAAGAVAEPVAAAGRTAVWCRARGTSGPSSIRRRCATRRSPSTSASASWSAATATPIPAFRVEMEFAGLRTTSWVTDTGEVVREESPLGLITVRETPERAQAMAVSGRMRDRSARGAAVVPDGEAAHRRAARRPPAPPAARRRRSRPRPIWRAAASASTATSSSSTIRRRCAAARGRPGCRAVPGAGAVHRKRRAGDRAEADARVRGVDRRPRARRAADAVRERAAREEADRQPAVGARGAAHEGRRLQRAHRALRRDGARARHPGADRGRPASTCHGAFYYHAWPEVYLDEARPRPVAAGRSDAEPVSRRRHAPAARARRPRQAGGDPAAHRPAEDDRARPRARAGRRRRFSVGSRTPADLGCARASRSRSAAGCRAVACGGQR